MEINEWRFNMKTIRVVAAVIRSENKEGRPIIFATQRGYGELKDGWEFSGGKIEEGETNMTIRHSIVYGLFLVSGTERKWKHGIRTSAT